MVVRKKRIDYNKILILLFLFELMIFIYSFSRAYDYISDSSQIAYYEHFDGCGTIDSPYVLSSRDDIVRLSELVNSGWSFKDEYFKMSCDIDMEGLNIDPIGIFGTGNYFYGVFDGNGYSIKNLEINTGGNDGLFGILGGTVMNLGIDGGFIGNRDYQGCSGSIASHAASASAKIINCYNTATVGGYRAGGIADNFMGVIINCWSDCELLGIEIGGTTSYVSSIGPQSFCYSTSMLSGDGSGRWFECKQINDDELYSEAMAKRLTANCLIWFETMTPVKQLKEWSYQNGMIELNSKPTTYWSIVNIIGLLYYSIEYYTGMMVLSLLLVFVVLYSILKRLKKEQAMNKDIKKQKCFKPYEAVIKRIFDIILSGLGLILLSPLIIIIAIIVRIKMGSPVLFAQDRPGKDSKIFKMYKFRTMTDARDANGELLPDYERLPKFGKILRATSLDELPELINILKGDMSIVGPRPLLVRYLPYYTEQESHRHDVRPGLTGLSQIHGRNFATWEERFAYDLTYVNNISFLGDIKIILDSIKVVLSHSGVADRSQIIEDENGELYIIIDGVKRKYPRPLDVERGEK